MHLVILEPVASSYALFLQQEEMPLELEFIGLLVEAYNFFFPSRLVAFHSSFNDVHLISIPVCK